jgi:hypothetical protein
MLYRKIGNLPLHDVGASTQELTEIVGLVPAVYSDYQAFAGYPSSAHDDPRAAAMKHAIGFVLGAHLGLMSRGMIGVKGNLDFTICDESYSGPSSFAWVIEQAADCESRLAYLTTLAHARFHRERYFRGEYLGPAEDRSPAQMISDYWCRFASCAPPGQPPSDICTDGNRPDDPSCSDRFRQVILPAVRGGAWISPDGDRAIVLTNTDEVDRVVDIPVPRSWSAEFESAELCRADLPDPVSSGDCSSVSVADGVAAAVSVPAYGAYFLRFAAAGTTPGPTRVSVASQGVERIAAGGPNRKARCSIRVEDSDGNPVADAWVSADYTGPTVGSVTAPVATDANGEIVLESTKTKSDLQDTWCFTVTDVSVSGAAWDGVAGEVCESS